MKPSGPRVVHLGKYYPPAPGGIESHVQTLARAQAALGMDVHVVCFNHADRHGKDITWIRHGTTPTVHERDGQVRLTRLGRSASMARLDICPQLPRVLARLEEAGMDVLHLHTPNPMMLMSVMMAGPSVPLVITHHSDIVRQRLLKLALRPFELMVYRRAAVILATSPRYLRGSGLLKRYAAQVRSLPLGVNLEGYLRPSEQVLKQSTALKAEHGEPLWLSVGRCVYYKHYHVAVAALAHVPGKLMIVGNGPTKGELVRQARALGVENRIIWREQLSAEELAGAYRAATALWFPSGARSEAYGLVQVEAMASGCPVINAYIEGSGVPWVSRHERTGITVAVDDAAGLAAAARRLLEEPGLRDRLGAAAAVRAAEDFDHMTMAQRSFGIYEQAIRSGRVIRLPVGEPKRMRRGAGYGKKLDAGKARGGVEVDAEEEAGLAL